MSSMPKWKWGLALAAVLAISLAGGFGGGVLYSTAQSQRGAESGNLRQAANALLASNTGTATMPSRLTELPASFADIADQVVPAVVSVRSVGQPRVRAQRPAPPQSREFTVPGPSQPGATPPGAPPPGDMRRWFEFFDQSPQGQQEMPPDMAPREGQGTGFVIASDGYIVTNAHVVDIARGAKYTVTFADGTERPAQLIGQDTISDVAVLKVDAPKPLATVPMGDSRQLRAGDWVVAIGNPFGLQHTVTAGIVSAFRDNQEIQGRRYHRMIQTDAAINHGNSGGPLVNTNGEVVGINTAIVAPGGFSYGFTGVGFAIPIDEVQQIVKDLIEHGNVTRSWLGLGFGIQTRSRQWDGTVTKEIAERDNLHVDKGVFVGLVDAEGPSAKAGLREGDIVVKVNDREVVQATDVQDIIWKLRVGDSVALEIVNAKGEHSTVKVRLDQRPSDEELDRRFNTNPDDQ